MNHQPKKRKRLVKILAGSVLGLLVLYVGSYIPNSLAGGWMVNESGKVRLGGMLANCDQYIWMPRYGFCQKFRWSGGRDGIRAGGLGYLYCPLILLDQAYFHPTIRFLNEDMTEVKPFPVPLIEEYHPTMVNPFAGRFPYQQVTNETEETAEQSPAGDVLKAAPEE